MGTVEREGLEDFHFRWLKITGIYTGTSVTVLSDLENALTLWNKTSSILGG